MTKLFRRFAIHIEQTGRLPPPAYGLLVALSLMLGMPAVAGEFRAGAAAIVITPPAGTPLAGYYYTRPASGVLDNLYAKAIVVEQDRGKAAFVVLDLAYTTRPTVAAARQLIAEQCGIAPERVMISATHTHTGPVQARDGLTDTITGAKTEAAVKYAAGVPALIAQAVAAANSNLVAARAWAAIGREEHVSFNRRYRMKDGSVAWQPVKWTPAIVGPAGPIDPDVGVCYFAAAGTNATPLATYVNFAMHPTVVGGAKVSADYPGRLARRLADSKGSNMLAIVANGCCGDVNAHDIHRPDRRGGPAEAERIGAVLAADVFRAWPNLQPLATFAPRVASTILILPRRQITDEEVSAARATFDRFEKHEKISTATIANAVCVLDTLARKDTPIEAEVQAIALSDTFAIVALPGEIFAELGLSIKKKSPFKYTFIAEQANGSIGYVPARAAYPDGQYEVVNSRCAAGAGEMLVDAALKLLADVHSSVAD